MGAGFSWKEGELGLFEQLKERRIFEPITQQSFPCVPILVCVMCNAGFQLKDRLSFYWDQIANIVHPVMTHGGIARLYPHGNFFDESLRKGVLKALKVYPQGVLAVEGHYPCIDTCSRGLNFIKTLNCCSIGAENLQGILRKRGMDIGIPIFFHLDFTGTSFPGKKMETYLVNKPALDKYDR